MKILKIFYAIAFIGLAMISCKSENKNQQSIKTNMIAKVEEASFAISGIVCEKCVKRIVSDLTKKEGVLSVKVILVDSIATIQYDANKTNKADLMVFVDRVAGKMYKSSDMNQ